MDVRVEVDRERQSAAVPGEAAPRPAGIEIADSPPHGALSRFFRIARSTIRRWSW
jgi:hypothetical protein